jgi:ubiquitin C-terminal hydrolase
MHVIGLPNLGNTCYFNSCLQTILYNRELYAILSDYKDIDDDIIHNFYLLQSMCVNSLNMSKHDFIIVIKNLYKAVIIKSGFRFRRQEDSAECILFLLDYMHERIKRPVLMNLNNREQFAKDELLSFDSWNAQYAKEYSGIIRGFYGQYQSTLTCGFCHEKSSVFEPFNVLSLPVDDTCDTVSDCFHAFTRPEDVDGTCEKCKSTNTKEKSLMFYIMPKFLCIKLKNIDYETSAKQLIELETTLETKDFMCKGYNYTYQLYSVIYHSGALQGGHYYAYHKFNNKHVMLNDTSVSEVQSVTPKNACVLWYRMVE